MHCWCLLLLVEKGNKPGGGRKSRGIVLGGIKVKYFFFYYYYSSGVVLEWEIIYPEKVWYLSCRGTVWVILILKIMKCVVDNP